MREFYHANNRAHLRDICKRERIAQKQSRDFERARRLIPFPALLDFAGFPKLRNQQCFNHKGTTGTSFSFFEHHRDGHPIFFCNNPACGIEGDIIDFWYQVVLRSRLQPASWSRPQACADLLARMESGEIDTSITEFDDASPRGTHGHPPARNDPFQARLRELIGQRRSILRASEALPKPVRMSVKEAIMGLFPENRLLMITPKRNWHDIKMRDEWLANYVKEKPPVCERSFISSNYLSRDDANCSYLGMDGVVRRWLVIEGDGESGTLEQQLWIHKELGKRHRLCCVCYSGGKSLHGWYLVDGLNEEQCFELYADAIRLGIDDCNTWRICQPVRLPNGMNRKTRRKQQIFLWNVIQY